MAVPAVPVPPALDLVRDQVLILVLIDSDAHLAGLVLSSINLGTTLVTAAILLRLLEQPTIDVSAVSPDGASGLQSPVFPFGHLPGLYHDEKIHHHLHFCLGSTTVPGFIFSYLKSTTD